MTNEETAQAIDFLNDSWPQKPMSDNTARIWGSQLAKHPASKVMAALIHLANSSKWRPSLSDILGMLEPSEGPGADEAFKITMASILPYPASERHKHIPAACMETVRRMGGWRVIGEWKTENMGIHAKEFARIYTDFREQEDQRQAIGTGTPALDMLRGGE